MDHQNQTKLFEYQAKFASVIQKYTGDYIGISAIKSLCDLITFCKTLDKKFLLPMPPKEISVVWTYSDWCDWIDSHWNKYAKGVRNGKL